MNIGNFLTLSAVVAKGTSVMEIAEGFETIFEDIDEDPCYFKPVEGLPFSARIISAHYMEDMASLPPSSSMGLAINLTRLSETEARYDPPENPSKQKGWEIRKAVIGGKPVAIALAKWI